MRPRAGSLSRVERPDAAATACGAGAGFKAALAGVLIVSALLTAVSGVLQTPRSAPDERHHYAKIKYLAEHWREFPPDPAKIFTEEAGEPNHLQHPPLYYYLMAGVYRILDPWRDYTQVGREEDRYGKVSAPAVIPALRAASRFLTYIGLWGVYLLACFLVDAGLLSRPAALAAALLSTWVPGFTYIGAALNNDALALCLWPFAVLATLQFVRCGGACFFWKAAAFIFLAVLTKATLWVLCLGLAATVAATVVVRRRRTPQGNEGAACAAAKSKSETLAWVCLAVVSAVFAGGMLISDVVRYGSLQPGYLSVYHIPLAQSKFYKAEGREGEIAARGRADVALEAAERLVKSTAGILGQSERLYPRYPLRLAMVFAFSVCLLIVAGLLNIGHGGHDRLRRTAVGCFLAIPAVMLAVYFARAYSGYKISGHFAAHGRYFIGYLPIFIFGLVMFAGSRGDERIWRRALRRLLTVAAVAGLAFAVCRPLAYIRSTQEIYMRSQIPSRVETRLRNEGYRRLGITHAEPAGALEGSRDASDKGYLGEHYTMDGAAMTLGGMVAVPPGRAALRVAVWAKGSTEAGEGARLAVGAGAPGAAVDNSAGGGGSFTTVSLSDDIELYRVDLDLPAGPVERLLYVKLLNHEVPTAFKFQKLWTLPREPILLGIFYKFEPPGGD